MTTYIYPDEICEAMRAVDYDPTALVLEGDLIFTSAEDHLSWLIENEAVCGMCLQRVPCDCEPEPDCYGDWVARHADEYRHIPQ